LLQAFDKTPCSDFGATFIKDIATELVIRFSSLNNVISDDQDGMGDSHDRAFLSTSTCQAVILGREIGVSGTLDCLRQ
jgi:hypothetical protein